MDKFNVYELSDFLPTYIAPADGGKQYEILRFKFINDKQTNDVESKGKLYRIEIIEFWGNYRVDLYEYGKMSAIGENTGNTSFRSMVNTNLPIHEQVIQWASRMINGNDNCDICGSYEIIKSLANYDIENFPQFKNKKVCQNCRTEAYNKLLKQISEDEKAEVENMRKKMKQQGYEYHYVYWVHPNGGDDFMVDVFTAQKLSYAEVEQEMKKLKMEYGARLVEEPSCFEL